MKINWKKIIVAAGLGISVLGCVGCKKKTVEEKENQDTLTICTQTIYMENMTKLIETWEYFNKPLKAELIVIPNDPDEAEIKISEIRTEMLAGGGPDVFLTEDIRCFNISKYVEEVQPMLFQNPEKAMYSGTFLPLDSYIKNAKYFKPEHYNPVIMEAGKTEEGQCLLPVAYDYRVCYFEEPQENPIQMPLPSWDSLVSGEAGFTSTMFPSMDLSFPDLLGEYADYENKKLLLSEEELYQYVLDSIVFGIFAENGPEVKGLDLIWTQRDFASFFIRNSTGYKQNPNSFLANPNREGGINANIITWAGINKNTKRPSQAFSFLDLLFSDEVMTFLGTPRYLFRFWKSLGTCLLIAMGQVVIAALAGYGFGKFQFPYKRLMLFFLMILMVLPLQVTEEDVTIIGALSEPYILRYASRPVLPGQMVEVTTQLETGEYSYLLVKETGQAEVFTVSGARPFMSKQTKSLLEIPQEYELYMVEDVLDFFRTLPWLFGILSVLCCSVFLWLYCLFGWKKIRKSRRRMVINVSLGAGLLAVSLWLTRKMNFPASLLPKNNMLEFWYYKEQFRKIFQALFDASAKTAGMVSDTLQTSVLSGIGILVIGTLTFIFLTILMNKKGEC